MAKQRIGRGPLSVALEDQGTTHPRLYVRDGSGLVMVLPVHVDALPDVRRHLDEPVGEELCDVELVDEAGAVASRWGSFAHRGQAAALAVVLLGSDRTLVDARVVPATGTTAARSSNASAATASRSAPGPESADHSRTRRPSTALPARPWNCCARRGPRRPARPGARRRRTTTG